MAKAALETAVLDAELRAAGMSFAAFLGAVRDRVPAGVSVGIMDSIPELLDAVERYLDEGYVRIKLKIEPGWDVEPVRAVRERFGDDAAPAGRRQHRLHPRRRRATCANWTPSTCCSSSSRCAEDDLHGHAQLARRLTTPVCLDESIDVRRATPPTAIAMGACSDHQRQTRPGRRLPRRPAASTTSPRAHGVPVWCGGMLETGIGRAANLALAALPGFTLPGDTSASGRYFAEDITEPFVLEDGHLPVPTGPGIGVAPLPDTLARFTTATRVLYSR